jgi:hypothetical protein
MTIAAILVSTLAGILAYDTAASLLSRRIGFNYAYATVGSLVLYAAAGFAAAEAASFEAACLVGGAAGLTDATLGWRISWVLGPGRLPSGKLTLSEWSSAASFGVGLGIACAAAGAWLAMRA